MNEPIYPELGETVKHVFKHVETPCKNATPDKVFSEGKFVDYVGPITYSQDIRAYVVFNNGSIFEQRTTNTLKEKSVHQFLEPGYYEKNGKNWQVISKEKFYKTII